MSWCRAVVAAILIFIAASPAAAQSAVNDSAQAGFTALQRGDADIVGHSLPSAEEVAWTLLMLKDRGWLSIRGELYALTAEGRSIVQSIVGNGNLRERTQRLEEWISTHPLKGNQRESW